MDCARRLAVLIFVGLAALGGATVSAAQVRPLPPPAPDCRPLERPLAALEPAAGATVVPVIIHYMTVDHLGAPESQRVRALEGNRHVLASADHLESLFGSPRPEMQTPYWRVNDVWARAGIQFRLARVERCEFQWGEAGGVPLPPPSRGDLRRFRALNLRFNTPGVRGINVYQWPEIEGVGSFAAPRSDAAGPGDGGVWFHPATLLKSDPWPSGWQVEALRMAHDLGHVLGLADACGGAGPVGRDRQAPCPPAGSSGRLMSEHADGEALSCEEMRAARAAALALLGVRPAARSEGPCP